MSEEISIEGLSRAEVLAALFNGARPLGSGALVADMQHVMSVAEAEQLLERHDYFDYVEGRVMKVKLPEGATSIRVALYDRDNGQGHAARMVGRALEAKAR